jgi:hypothetical protein
LPALPGGQYLEVFCPAPPGGSITPARARRHGGIMARTAEVARCPVLA